MIDAGKPARRLLLGKRTAGIIFLCAVAALSGCQTLGYYKQAVQGECQILCHRQPIKELLANPKTSPELKHKFNLVLEIRAFAERDLKLPAEDQYLRYVDVHRPYVVWNVHAAPEFSLQPKTWWYPFVGSLKYRGYFSENGAQRYARSLSKKGWEVYVEGVEAYSTLGWFKDPLLNTFITEPDPELAEILFHELAHQRVFIHGDTDFNEAFATTVGEEGVRRWLQAKNTPEELQRYLSATARNEQFVALVMAARARLKALYGPGEASQKNSERKADEIATIRQQKNRIIAQLRDDYAKKKAEWKGAYQSWFAKALNNAQLNTVAAYYELVPGFRAVLQEHGGDLEKFYKAVRSLGQLSKKERHKKLLAAAAGSVTPAPDAVAIAGDGN